MSVMTKINELALENGFKTYRIKYLESFGFAKVFYKVRRYGNNTYLPVFVLPIEEDRDDEEDLLKFKKFLIQYGLNRYFDLSNLSEQDLDSLLAIIKCVDNESLSMSGGKKPHEDKDEKMFSKLFKDRVENSLEPLHIKLREDNRDGQIVCFYNESEDVFCVISSDSNDFESVKDKFDSAYSYDIAYTLKRTGL